jgi:hypothetical protein
MPTCTRAFPWYTHLVDRYERQGIGGVRRGKRGKRGRRGKREEEGGRGEMEYTCQHRVQHMCV